MLITELKASRKVAAITLNNQKILTSLKKQTQTTTTKTEYVWYDIYVILRDSQILKQKVIKSINNLLFSKQRFTQLKKKDPVLKKFVEKYEIEIF